MGPAEATPNGSTDLPLSTSLENEADATLENEATGSWF
jgi:hypothetical protein